MEIRIKETGQVMYEGEFRQLYPNTSFPQQISADTLNDFGADVVLEGPQASPTRYQTAFRDGVQEIDGKWYTKYSVADIDDEAKTAKDAEQAKAVRTTRGEKLKDSDWTQVADAPVDKAVWATYRQALRDVTAQSGFPWEVTWPTQP
jgi:hypothetical protein